MPPEVQTAWIAAFSAIIVAYFSYLGIKAGIERSRRKKAERPEELEQDEALVRYEDNPAQFVKDLFTDNKSLRDEARELRDEMKLLRQDMADLRTELESFKRDDTRFRDALGRWLARIFTSWGVEQTMPWPPDDDALILKSVLPHR